MDKKIIAREWLIFISTFILGFLVLPILVTLIAKGSLPLFYEALVNCDRPEFIFAWLIAAGPYLLIQVMRVSIWSIKQLKSNNGLRSE